jgi:hypothetical protein
MNVNYVKLAASILTASLLLNGCGSGGSSGTNSGTVTVSGVAADGYLQNSRVCLDLNNNDKCDNNEPVAVTNATGAFTLHLTASQQNSNASIIVEGGMDVDTGKPFTGTIKSSLKTGVSVNITPVTTLVEEVRKGDAVSETQAKQLVAEALGLNVDDLDKDPVNEFKKGSKNLAKTALDIHKTVEILAHDEITKGKTISVAKIYKELAKAVKKVDKKVNKKGIGEIVSFAAQTSTFIDGNLTGVIQTMEATNTDTLVNSADLKDLAQKVQYIAEQIQSQIDKGTVDTDNGTIPPVPTTDEMKVLTIFDNNGISLTLDGATEIVSALDGKEINAANITALTSLQIAQNAINALNDILNGSTGGSTDTNTSGGTGGSTGGNAGGTPTTGTGNGKYTLLAWNDLGMHCFDGSDFSVFSILPPYNTLNAQLIQKVGTSNKHITTGVTLTYEALNYNGRLNTHSASKTNFWDYLTKLFPGASSTPEVGLTGNRSPSFNQQPLAYIGAHGWWEASGIPLINRDDDNLTNYYPMVKVVAKDSSTGEILATADVVLPVSDEMDCAKCHASNTVADAKPSAGWENNANTIKDFKFNILKLHDDKHQISQATLDALASSGYNYQSSLYDTAKSGTPILCAACHSSNALGTAGIGDIPPLTTALHTKHANVIDPANGLTLNSSSNRNACYSCHPGAATQCLRGAMGKAVDANGNLAMACQSCHGKISDVGNPSRTGWLDEPNCQACHEGGNRYLSAIVNGAIRQPNDTTFATNPNTPTPGHSLYRYSTGHGGLKCSACHGSTHAIFPTSHAQDNMLSESIQGHSGTISECTSCHDTMPSTTNEGPHGMHSIGTGWEKDHQKVAEKDSAQCTSCHGSDYKGTFLSKTFTARTLKHKTYKKGDVVSCYDCHNKKW